MRNDETQAASESPRCIAWGEDTRCTVCWCRLPAGATAYIDGDGTLCADCAAAEDVAAAVTAVARRAA